MIMAVCKTTGGTFIASFFGTSFPAMPPAVMVVKRPGPAVVAPMGGAVASAERSAMG